MPRVYICPYWNWEEKLSVHCEGGLICFPDARMKREFVCRYCAHLPGWERCTIAGAWGEYYERQ